MSAPFDLFWEPAAGDLVRLKPACKSGVRAFDDYPLRVKKSSDIDGHRIFDCETTGPIEARTLPTERVVRSHPLWISFYTADELTPEVSA